MAVALIVTTSAQ